MKSKLGNLYYIDEVKFNMVKVKVKKDIKMPISMLFELSVNMQEELKFIKTVSINTVNLEEIFWNLNQNYKVDN